MEKRAPDQVGSGLPRHSPGFWGSFSNSRHPAPSNRPQTVLHVGVTWEALKTAIPQPHARPGTSELLEGVERAKSETTVLAGQGCQQPAQSRISSAKWRQAASLPAARPPNPNPCRAQSRARPGLLPKAPGPPNKNRRPEFRAPGVLPVSTFCSRLRAVN